MSPEGGSSEQMIKRGLRNFDFSPDGKKIIFTSPQEGFIDLWEMSVDGSKERQISRLRGKSGGFSWGGQTAGNDKVFFSWGEDTADLWVIDVEWK